MSRSIKEKIVHHKKNRAGIPVGILREMKNYPIFYQRVWKACAEIPKGKIRTYGWIALKIGQPGASRAVGTALAKNPFAPNIPCHRVIRKDGSWGGYSGPGGIKT